MRKAPLLLRLLTLALLSPACGARTAGDWSASSSGGQDASATTGGVAAIAGTGGVVTGSGGSPSFGGAAGGAIVTGGISAGGVVAGGVTAGGGVAAGGVTAGGGIAAGGVTAGGTTIGGTASGGQYPGGTSSGGKPCFEATQPGQSLCIHVRLCPEVQYETLCLLDTATTAICFCYTDGAVVSAASVLSASYDTLCGDAERSRCP